MLLIFKVKEILGTYELAYLRYFLVYLATGYLLGFCLMYSIPKIFRFYNIDIEGDYLKKNTLSPDDRNSNVSGSQIDIASR